VLIDGKGKPDAENGDYTIVSNEVSWTGTLTLVYDYDPTPTPAPGSLLLLGGGLALLGFSRRRQANPLRA